MKLWQRVLLASLVGISNFVGLLLSAVPMVYMGGLETGVVLVIGYVMCGFFSALVACAVVQSRGANCSVTALAVGIYLADVALLILTTVAGGWMDAHGLNNLIGLLAILPVMIVIIMMTTFWRSSRAMRIAETATAVATWVTFLALLTGRRWEFAESEYRAATARFFATLYLAATLPFIIALLVAFWRDRDSASRTA